MNEKIQQYFAAGTQVVWTIYPKTRMIEIEQPHGAERLYSGDTIRAPGLIPELSIAVDQVCALLNE